MNEAIKFLAKAAAAAVSLGIGCKLTKNARNDLQKVRLHKNNK